MLKPRLGSEFHSQTLDGKPVGPFYSNPSTVLPWRTLIPSFIFFIHPSTPPHLTSPTLLFQLT